MFQSLGEYEKAKEYTKKATAIRKVTGQLKYFMSVFFAAFVTIIWYVNGNVH